MPLFDNEDSYRKLMVHLGSLQAFALITTGRTGTDFLQSLLDSHTEVLTFNGMLFYHDFWNNSKCVKADTLVLSDILDASTEKDKKKMKNVRNVAKKR